jgi:nucleoside-diphosphate-sugar epimerase
MVDGRPAIVLDSRLARLRLSRGYVENVAEAAVAAVSDDRAAGRTFNVAEPDALSESEWAREIGVVFGWDGDVVAADAAQLPPELHVSLPPQDLFGDTSRIRRELGYAESVDRREGLRRAIDWELAQQRDEVSPDYASEDSALRALGLV